MQLTCETKCFCIKCASIEILLISIETGETVFAVNVFDENVPDDKLKEKAKCSLC